MKEYRVLLPEEHFQLVEFRQEDLPAIGVINSALQEFEPKEVFSWHLSVIIDFEGLIDNGMPSQAERDILEPWEDQLDSEFKGFDPEKPNALFLARITWNGTRQLIYRVFDPEQVNEFLQSIIASGRSLRPFDYRIDPDEDWKLTEWYLNTALRG
ncbi:DUF695 domain-containing protein [Verrucomicrobiaceae bacterium N1E253]|uniref:DUF695 domain-containing protein n=1 Tax=Oceaniferula marina TaxID=2748318 RepID=A0A851GL41_9BACT|nr:DUF695 domain-containing protein [Oceaniferula marina]NWK57782.1 DUF695 domain-containing protein [Oceaniferula marina]